MTFKVGGFCPPTWVWLTLDTAGEPLLRACNESKTHAISALQESSPAVSLLVKALQGRPKKRECLCSKRISFHSHKADHVSTLCLGHVASPNVSQIHHSRRNRVMHTFGGKTQQQARGKRLGGWWRDLLLSFSTESVHDPRNMLTLRAIYQNNATSATDILGIWN